MVLGVEHNNYFECCFYVTVIIVLATTAGKGVFLFYGLIAHYAEFLSILTQCGEVPLTSLMSLENHFFQIYVHVLFLLLGGFLSSNDP